MTRQNERGAAALVIAVTMVVLVGFVAFTTDFGNAYGDKRKVQNAVDAAALAAANRIMREAPRGPTCTQLAIDFADEADATAREYFTANMPETSATVPAGTTGVKLTCDTAVGGMGLNVVVNAVQNSETFFGGILGVSQIPVPAKATAVVGAPNVVIGARPIAVCQVTATNLITQPPGTVVKYPLDNSNGDCGNASGNFGWLDMDGGSNPTGDLERWITTGYEGTVVDSATITGNPGFRTTLADALHNILGTDITVPVFDTVSGNGSNASYHITGFLTINLCGYRLNNQREAISPCTTSDGGDWLKMSFVKFQTIGEYDPTCRINDPTCDFGARLVKLAG